MKTIARVLAAAVLLSASVQNATAQDGVRVLVSNGLKAAMEHLRPSCEGAVGRPLAMEFNSTAGLKARIEAGDRFDATLITREAIDDLIKSGKLTAGSRIEIGRSPLVIGIRAGATRSDIRTLDGLKRAFLQARSITYPRDGASRGYIEKVFADLGIAAEVKPRIVLASGSGPATQSVADGHAEMVLTLASETAPVPGVEVLGPFPGRLAYDIYFAGAASSTTVRQEAVKALLSCVKGAQAAVVLKANGVDVPATAK